jgi:hypothetical protein
MHALDDLRTSGLEIIERADIQEKPPLLQI